MFTTAIYFKTGLQDNFLITSVFLKMELNVRRMIELNTNFPNLFTSFSFVPYTPMKCHKSSVFLFKYTAFLSALL